MFDHLSLGVRDLPEARRFYDGLLAPLGHAVSATNAQKLSYGPGGLGEPFVLYPVDGEQVAGLGTHVAFAADSRAAVDQAYAAAVAAGGVSVRPAGEHPDIAPGYYGCVLFDLDGNKLEIVAGAMH
ncbi:MAG: lactoylglutathione lyase [Phenylobacterium sp.]|nr:lactoylglutathione lyase [Phenylobacterium sp.]